MRIKKMSNRGFTLVELMIVVAIVGVLAALAIYGVRKYVLNAKTAEARNALGQMSKDAATAYSRESMDATVVELGKVAGVSHKLCGAANKVPAEITEVKGQKYQSKPSEWGQGTGWDCLRFTIQDPQYYQYEYTLPKDDQFFAYARGDLDGDDETSEFSIEGLVQSEGDKVEKVVTIAPNIKEVSPDE